MQNLKKFARASGVLVCGTAIGWLVGLSVSPVVQGVITTVLALVATVVSALPAVQGNSGNSLDAERTESRNGNLVSSRLALSARPPVLPLMLMLLGLALGSSCGIYARTHDLLTPKPASFAARWGGTGVPADQLQRILLQELYPSFRDAAKPQPSPIGKSDNGSIHWTVLHALPAEDCLRLKAARDASDLKTKLKMIFSSTKAQAALDSCPSEQLEKIRTVVCGE